MKKLYARKMTLLSVIAVLLAVYIVQLVSSGRTNVKVFSVAENVDRTTSHVIYLFYQSNHIILL